MQNDERRIAVFIDFENVAMGVRESKYGNFDIDLVLKRLVEKGKIMVKRAYSDWHRYSEFKRAFHQAAIELIDVPQTRYSGKNSADIRMVVDALDLSYQKDHIDTFVLVSGDSDFSPLVSKLRENGRHVIGMGVKQSSSDLLINNCDEFIFYEDLVRPTSSVPVVDPQLHHLSPKKAEAIRLVLETFQALQREGKEVIYGSMIKQTLIRKLPSFNETYYGYPMFSRLLEDAAENQLLKLAKDQKSGGYIVTLPNEPAPSNVPGEGTTEESQAETGVTSVASASSGVPEVRDRFRRGRWDRGRARRPPGRFAEGAQSVRPFSGAASSPGSSATQSTEARDAKETENMGPSQGLTAEQPAFAGTGEPDGGRSDTALLDASPGLRVPREISSSPAENLAQDMASATPTTEPGDVVAGESAPQRLDSRAQGGRRPLRFPRKASPRPASAVPANESPASTPANGQALTHSAKHVSLPEVEVSPTNMPQVTSSDTQSTPAKLQVAPAHPRVRNSNRGPRNARQRPRKPAVKKPSQA